MQQLSARRLLSGMVFGLVLALVSSILVTRPALAHAELRQSSPEAGETVGGEFHSIALQFFGLDPVAPQNAQLYDPAGELIETTLVIEEQRLILPIEPLEVPGEYTVIYAVNGLDGDFTEESFSFRFSPEADEPKGITIDVGGGDDGIDLVTYFFILVAAAIAAFLVHRFLVALREHRAAQAANQITS